MSVWWNVLVGSWEWDDPMIVLGVVTAIITALIPIFIWRLGSRQSVRDHEMRTQQASALGELRQIAKRQRRDALLDIVDGSDDPTHLTLLWSEVHEYTDRDLVLLQRAFRANVAVALPGTALGQVSVADVLTKDEDVAAYVAGLERRFEGEARAYGSYPGLLDFLRHVRSRSLSVDVQSIVNLVTGPTSEVQRPGHTFFRELVTVLPESASALLYKVDVIDYRTSGGTRLNVLTGALMAIKDAEIGCVAVRGRVAPSITSELRGSVPTALATLLHRESLRSLDRWSLDGSTEPVSATVAWLVRAVGWLADVDDHLAMRMVENLAAAIRSVPEKDRGWGIDDKDVRAGFEGIRQKQPALWAEHGHLLEDAASEVGRWHGSSG